LNGGQLIVLRGWLARFGAKIGQPRPAPATPTPTQTYEYQNKRVNTASKRTKPTSTMAGGEKRGPNLISNYFGTKKSKPTTAAASANGPTVPPTPAASAASTSAAATAADGPTIPPTQQAASAAPTEASDPWLTGTDKTNVAEASGQSGFAFGFEDPEIDDALPDSDASGNKQETGTSTAPDAAAFRPLWWLK